MNCLIVYDTVYGNTKPVARAIGVAFAPTHSVRLVKADQIASLDEIGEVEQATRWAKKNANAIENC